MFDVAITGGTVIDGTGTPGVRADVGIRNGRVIEIGDLTEAATRTIDASDQVVAPGFIDIHTHYDAQAFWDTTLSPSPLHGVTTVMGGNCGFTIAPLTPEDGDYLMRMLARVEGMPLESLQKGVPWDWRSTAEYLDRIDGTLMPNAGFLVGHSAIRRVVMKDQATERAATEAEIRTMQALLREGLAAGGMGFSSTWSTSHNDHTGVPVPSRHATAEEVIALCSVVKEFPGTTLEFIPQVGPFTAESFNLMAAMSVAANRPLNWNLLQVQEQNWEQVQHQLTGGDIAAAQGGRVLALTLPDTFRLRLNLRSGFVLDILPGWDKLMALAPDAKIAMLRDPAGRAEMDRLAQSATALRGLANWGTYTLLETFTERWKRFEGQTLHAIATEVGGTPWDLLAEIAIDDDLNTVIASMDSGQTDASWERRVEVWRDPRAIVGASDAGAHLDMIDSFSYATTLLHRTTVQRSLLPLEEAVHYLTGAPAALYGLTGRGVVKVDNAADLVIFDPTRIGPGEVFTKFDLPGGSGRVYGESVGINHVMVNGVVCVEGGELLDARPGTLLRSGRDTHTVTAQP